MASARQHPGEGDFLKGKGAEAERTLVQRILSSQCFEKSARMRDFLAYVCERALNDPQAEIREQDIGCAVFGRPADYDTNQDNIVRVNAAHLRKKLETYFASEGSAEPLVLELPKGQYRPLFRLRSETDAAPKVILSAPDDRVLQRRVWILACLSVVLALLCVGLAVTLFLRARSVTEPAGGPAQHALWSRLFQNGRSTSVVLSDSSLGLTQDLIGKAVPLSEYIHPDIWRQAPSLASRPEAQVAARFAARRRHTDMSSVHVARRIVALAGSDQSRVALYFARDFSLRQMKSDNVVLLGSRRTNPWVEIVESRMHFRFGFDQTTRQACFENPLPLAGELQRYANDPSTSYCQIAFLPNVGSAGNILVISGTDVEGTEAGGEFLTSEAGLTNLRKRLPSDRTGQFPYFEALLKSNRIGGTTPGCEIVLARSAKSK
ncbi:MAG: hypothetical protein LLG20_25425 [Acidobacteriales bacterium]|nr:hypothetical protein [Terriglobales bacterium]